MIWSDLSALQRCERLNSKQWDVALVGFGIAGSAFLHKLLQVWPACQVLAIDRGGWPERLVGTGGTSISSSPPSVIVSKPGGEARMLEPWWDAGEAGGGFNLWYGQVSRFTNEDFTLRSHLEAMGRNAEFPETRDWPITLQSLEKYYDEVEADLKPYGRSEAGKIECSLSEIADRAHISHFERTLHKAWTDAGHGVLSGATCLGGREWERRPVDPETGCEVGQAQKQLLRRNYAARLFDQAAESENVHVVLQTSVSGLQKVNDGSGVDLTLTNRGMETCKISSRTIALGAGTINTVGLLLNSGLDREMPQIGQHVNFTTELVGYIATDIPRSTLSADQHASRFGHLVLRDKYLESSNQVVKGGKISVYDSFCAETRDKRMKYLARIAPDPEAEEKRAQQNYLLKLSFKGEALNSAEKRICLSEYRTEDGFRLPEVKHQPHAHDKALVSYISRYFSHLAETLPGSRLLGCIEPESSDRINAHQHGGAVGGRSPDHSVCNPDGELWKVPGCYVIDGAFFPTSGGTNSSLTIMANARRIADCIANGGSHENRTCSW